MNKSKQWGLATGDKVLSMHPNIEGAKLSALFHVSNGDTIDWLKPDHTSLDATALIGKVNGVDKFVIYRY